MHAKKKKKVKLDILALIRDVLQGRLLTRSLEVPITQKKKKKKSVKKNHSFMRIIVQFIDK